MKLLSKVPSRRTLSPSPSRLGIHAWRRSLALVGGLVLLILIPSVLLVYFHPNAAKASWFDTNWGFRQRIPITNSSGTTQTNFQVQLTVDTATLITNNKMLSSCNDLRVTSNVGKLLPYWIEPTTCNTSTTKIWVKVDSIPTTNGEIYIYYGNPSASAPGNNRTTDVFIRDMQSAAATWPLQDAVSTQSYSAVTNPAVAPGRNILLNGTPTSSTSWTLNTGWSYANNLFTHTPGNSGTLTQTGLPLVTGKFYKLVFTVSGMTAGQITVTATRTTNGTYTEFFSAASTTLTFTPTSAFDGSISNISLVQMNVPASGGTATQLFVDGDMEASGTSAWQAVNSTISKDTTTPHGGTQSLKVAYNGTIPYARQSVLNSNVSVYRVHGYTRSDGTAVPVVYVNNHSNIVFTGTTSTSWQPFDALFVIPSGQDLDLGTNTSTPGTYVEYDDVTLTADTNVRPDQILPDNDAESITVTGTATSGGAGTLTDSSQNWVVNSLVGQNLTIVSGTGAGQNRGIISNTATTITTTAWGTAPDNTSHYQVFPYWLTQNGNAVPSKVTASPHSGTYALRMTSLSGQIGIYQNVLVSGKTYRLTGWYRTDGTDIARISTNTVGINLSNPSSWTFFDVYIAPTNNPGLFLMANTTGWVEYDDMSLTELDPMVGLPNGVSFPTAAGGHLTNAYSFNGTSNLVNIYSSDLNSAFNPNEGTLVAWAKVNSSADWTTMSSQGGEIFWTSVESPASAQNAIRIAVTSSNNLLFTYVAGNVGKNVSNNSLGATTNWFQVVLTWSKSSDQMKAYINGAQVGTTQTGLGTWVGNLLSTNTNIGGIGGTNQPWKGYINDVHLYPYALSAAQISDLYGNGTTDRQAYYTENFTGHELIAQTSTSVTVGSAATEETATSPLLWWKFDDGTGTSTKDASSNANTGTLGGTTVPTWQTEDQCISGKCLFFDGASSKVTGSKVANGVKSIAFWIRPNTIATQGLLNFDGGTHKISTNGSGVISATGFTSPTYYVNGVATTTPTLVQNQWNYVEITTGTSFNTTSSFTVGTDGTNFIKGFIDEVRFYSYARTQAQVNADFLIGQTKIGGSSSTSNNQQQFLSQGLAGYWKFDEASGAGSTLADSSGNGNTATANLWGGGNTSTDSAHVAGKFGNAFSFDGGDDYLDAGNISNIDGLSQLTVSTWVKSTAFARNNTIATKYDFSSSGTWAMQTGFGNCNGSQNCGGTNDIIVFINSGGQSENTTSSPLINGQFNHVVFVFDGTQTGNSNRLKIYVNGVLQQSLNFQGTIPAVLSSSSSHVQFGQFKGLGRFFNGSMDEMRIYNRALSAQEVSQLYNYAPGPVGWWKMDERTGTSAFDSSGFGNTGTWAGTGATHWVTGKYGSAGNFNGIDDNVSITNTLPAMSYVSTSAWIKTTQSTSLGATLISRDSGSGSGRFWQFLIQSGNLQMVVFNNSSTNSGCTGTQTVSDGNWHYVAGTWDGTNIRLYIDGVLNTTCAFAGSLTLTGSQAVNIGRFQGGGNRPFNGIIDDARIYNYARTQSQVQQDMQGSTNANTNSGGSTATTQPAAPLAYWKFDEGYGTTANNNGSGGSALNGTLTNMASPATSTSGWQVAASNCKINKCLAFDGSNDFVSVPDQASLNFGSTDFSISTWVKITAANFTSSKCVLGKGTNATTYGYRICYNNNGSSTTTSISFGMNNNGFLVTSSANAGVVNQWQHLVITRSGSTFNLYVNGTLNATGTSASAITTNSNTFTIGEAASDSPSQENIDEVKIFPFALTQDQVRTDYNLGSSVNYGTGTVEASNFTSGAGSATGLVGDWEFEEKTGTTVNDSSGQGNTGTWNGTGTSHWTEGKYGEAGNFNGVDDYVSVPDASSIDLSTNFTVSMWAYVSSSQVGNPVFYDSGNQTNHWLVNVVSSGGNYKLDFLKSGLTNFLGNTTVTTNTWHYLTYVKNGDSGTNFSFYLDGVLDATASVGSVTTPSGAKNIGRQTQPGNYLLGKIDNLKIYNYARSADQIAYDYNRGAPVARWKMDECQGTTINDASGNGNTGTLTVGASGTQTAAGTCNTAGTAWGNGSVGKYNSSINLDGTDDFVSIPDAASLDTSASFSVSTWFKLTTYNTEPELVNKGTKWRLGVTTSGGNKAFFIALPGGAVFCTTVIQLNQWYHLVGVYTGSQAICYLNGVAQTTAADSGYTSDTTPFRIGSLNGFGRFVNGQIDDVRIYNYALTQTQVNLLYNNGSAVNYNPVTGSP